MPFNLSFNNREGIIEADIQGEFTWLVMEKMVPEMAHLIAEKHCQRILLDFRKADYSLSTFKIYMTPEKLFDEFQKHNIDIRSLKRALLFLNNPENFRFFETVSINQAQSVRIFMDEMMARNWLAE